MQKLAETHEPWFRLMRTLMATRRRVVVPKLNRGQLAVHRVAPPPSAVSSVSGQPRVSRRSTESSSGCWTSTPVDGAKGKQAPPPSPALRSASPSSIPSGPGSRSGFRSSWTSSSSFAPAASSIGSGLCVPRSSGWPRTAPVSSGRSCRSLPSRRRSATATCSRCVIV